MKTFLISAAVIGALAASVPVSAQTTPPQLSSPADRPNRSLFGGGVGGASQALTLSVSFGGGYDTTILIGTTTPTDATPATTGKLNRTKDTFEQGSINLGYSLAWPRVHFNVSGGSSGVYFPGTGQRVFVNDSANSTLFVRVTKRTTLSGGETVGYSPFYSLLPISAVTDATAPAAPTPISVPDFTNSVLLGDHLTFATTAGVSHQVTQRLSLSAGYGYTTSTGAVTFLDQASQFGSAGFSYALGQGLSLAVAYMRGETWSGPPNDRLSSVGQSVSGGLNFNRALSLTRRLKLAFGTGVNGVTDGRQTSYNLVGNAMLTREIGRSWSAALSYNRTVGFVQVFQHPVFMDALGANIGGLITRRLQFHAGTGVTRGSVGINQPNSGFKTSYASTGLTIGLAGTLGVGANYAFYHYQFQSGVVLPEGLANRANSQTATVFLTFFEPLFERRGKTSASR